MTKREIGNKLEEIVVSYIKKIDPKCRRTKNSGGSTELEDVSSVYFMVQCKVDNIHKNIIIKKEDFDKLLLSLPVNSKRVPFLAHQQQDNLITVTLKIEDYFRTIYKCYETTGEIQ
jgi:hypothetical protein